MICKTKRQPISQSWVSYAIVMKLSECLWNRKIKGVPHVYHIELKFKGSLVDCKKNTRITNSSSRC